MYSYAPISFIVLYLTLELHFFFNFLQGASRDQLQNIDSLLGMYIYNFFTEIQLTFIQIMLIYIGYVMRQI